MKKPWRYTRKGSILSSAKQKSLSQAESLTSKYYQAIVDLPLTRFIDCTVDQNLFALVISGKPTDLQLWEAWEKIRLQYADAIGDREFRHYTRVKKEFADLDIQYSKVILAIQTLKNYYVKKFADIVNKILHSSFKFDVTNETAYENDLLRAYRRTAGIMMAMKLKRAQLDMIEEKYGTKEQTPTREYFYGVLISLSNEAKFQLTADNLTVFEFATRLRMLMDKAQTQNTKKRK